VNRVVIALRCQNRRNNGRIEANALKDEPANRNVRYQTRGDRPPQSTSGSTLVKEDDLAADRRFDVPSVAIRHLATQARQKLLTMFQAWSFGFTSIVNLPKRFDERIARHGREPTLHIVDEPSKILHFLL